MLEQSELIRYNRQLIIPDFGEEGQRKLKDSHVVIVGMGGLGCASATYLTAGFGLIGDAHADCCTHRQISLLAIESINKMRSLGFDVGPGDFAENITTEGIELVSLPVETRLLIRKEVILEVTQIGKECHIGCAIYRQIGKCIMPKEGVFAKVIQGGLVKAGDVIRVSGEES